MKPMLTSGIKIVPSIMKYKICDILTAIYFIDQKINLETVCGKTVLI